MSPEPGEEVMDRNILIAASFYNITDIKAENIQLILDGKNITSSAFVDNEMISYYISFIDPGKHEIELFTGEGNSITWSFFVPGEIKQKIDPIIYSGKLRTSTSIDQIDEESLSVSQLFFDFKGTAYEKLKFNAKIKLTNQENLLYQPRNVFGFKFNLGDILALNLGDTNPQLSHFTMSGKRIRGLDAALTWGWFNLHIVKGEINRTVQGELNNSYKYTVDVDEFGDKFLALSRQGYTYKQDVLAGRLAFGRGEKFQWGIHFLKARDDTLSVNIKVNNATITYSESDRTISGLDSGKVYTIAELSNFAVIQTGELWSGVKPKDNLVIGTDLRLNLDKKRIVLEGEVAFSLTNNNIWGGAVSKAELDTLIDDDVDGKLSSIDLDLIPFDPIDITDIFIINLNMVPLSPIDPSAFGDSADVSLFEAIMSMPSLAFRGRAVLNYWGNYFSIEYSQVGPEFISFGNPYLVKNKRELSISDKLKLLNNRLMVNVGYKHQDDNIMTTVDNIESQNTFSLGLNILPGPGLPTANLSFKTIDRDNGINKITQLTDSTYTDNRKNTRSNHFTFNLNHRFFLNWSHNINGTLMLLDKKDNVTDREPGDSQYIDPSLVSNVVNISLTTYYNIPLKTTLSLSTNFSEFSTGPGDKASQVFNTGNIDGEYAMNEGKYILKAGTNFAKGTGISDVSWIGFKGGVKVNIIERLSFNAQVEFRSKFISDKTTQSFIARANMDYSF
ncbi:MAG: hypothetical protein IIB95_07775 [Candidatus Marinimicrobia bacterium]|nr:hypothetical protein [Candidatus Neomarinimicrobiota bacterium]